MLTIELISCNIFDELLQSKGACSKVLACVGLGLLMLQVNPHWLVCNNAHTLSDIMETLSLTIKTCIKV